jgi:hypothetical protein
MSNYSVEDRYKRKEDKPQPPRLKRGPSGDVQAKLLEVKKYLTSLGYGNLLVEDDEPEFPPKPTPPQQGPEPQVPTRTSDEELSRLNPAERMAYEKTYETTLKNYETSRRIYDEANSRYIEHLKFHNEGKALNQRWWKEQQKGCHALLALLDADKLSEIEGSDPYKEKKTLFNLITSTMKVYLKEDKIGNYPNLPAHYTPPLYSTCGKRGV